MRVTTRRRVSQLLAVLTLVAASFMISEPADADVFTRYGVTYLVYEIGEGRCVVHMFDAENGSYIGSSSGAC